MEVALETNARWVELAEMARLLSEELEELSKKIKALEEIQEKTPEQVEELKNLQELYEKRQDDYQHLIEEMWSIEQDMEADARGDDDWDEREQFDFGESQADW